MDIVLERLVYYEGKLGTLGAVAVVVFSLVIGLGHGHLEKALGPLDLGGNLGQITDLERSAVLFNNLHQVDVVEHQIAVHNHKLILREIEGLVDKVDVLVFHPS